MERKMCVLDETKVCVHCGACDVCDLDPNKICDNCGKCLDEYNTDEKGFVKVDIEKILMGEGSSLEDFYMMGGLLDDDEDQCDDAHDHCHCGHDHSHDCDCGCDD